MTKQTTPHTQTQQNTKPEQTDFEMDENLSGAADNIYTRMEGAETGSDRSPRKLQTVARRTRRNTEPEIVAHEGSLRTRTPKTSGPGISSRPSREESARQKKVVKDRPDARAGVKH